MSKKGLKQADLVRFTDYTGPAIKKITNGESEPKFGFLKKILENVQDISADWLLTGRGDMLLSNTGNKNSEPKKETKDFDPRPGADIFNAQLKIIELQEEKINDLKKTVEELEKSKKFSFQKDDELKPKDKE